MSTGVGRQVRRIAATGIAATVCALGLSGVASAEPVIVGSCASTVKGEDGEPLTVDLLAAGNAPGVVGVGLGTESDAAIRLPVKEVVDTLGLSHADLVVNPLGQVCDVGQDTVNTLMAPVQEALPAPEQPGEPEAPSPEQPEPDDPGAAPEPAPVPDAPEPDVPEDGTDSEPVHLTAPDPQVTTPAGGTTPPDPVGATGAVNGPLAAGIQAPPAPVGPGLGLPEGGDRPEEAARQSGTAQALPAAQPHDRVPLVLAVVTLLVVIAALSRAWLRRKTA